MTRTFLNVVFRKDEAFQRRKFYLGQKVEKIQFQFTTFVHHLLKDQKAEKDKFIHSEEKKVQINQI